MSESPSPPAPGTPSTGQKFPCKGCGAKLDYDPSTRALKCPYCGHQEAIAASGPTIAEHSLEDFLARGDGASTVTGRSQEVKCNSCGAMVLLEDKVVVSKCPYCACSLGNQPEAAKAMITPDWVLPFAVEQRKAVESFNQWIASLWFAPNALKKFANLGQLNGIYVPFWAFDSKTFTIYHGERGDDYQETEHYTDTETYTENGETKTRQVQKTRTVTKTRWTQVNGQVRWYFKDIPVCASKSLPARYAASLSTAELKKAEGFRPEYLSGFTTERYVVGPKEGFDAAKEIMDVQIRQKCCADIGGDHQRLHVVNTRHDDVKFKHLLLPVWLASYRYREKSYRVMVNGQTGRVLGDRPYSWIKITCLVAVILAVIIGLVVLFNYLQKGQAKPNSSLDRPCQLHVERLPVAEPARFLLKHPAHDVQVTAAERVVAVGPFSVLRGAARAEDGKRRAVGHPVGIKIVAMAVQPQVDAAAPRYRQQVVQIT
jgi:predicted RNA-binding Zn-ribbon protein involved in translation (DUF1610 family)